ncbi:hypothetical protein JHN47_46675, partial [Streptomyces sp. MBT62]|nr:hypothetical protein [Streptomyces sp. MBT62]
MEAHNAWLEENYAAGHSLASGRQDPRTGCLLLPRAADRPLSPTAPHDDGHHQDPPKDSD